MSEREALRTFRPHVTGKPCPEKPWMLVTTLDWRRGICGACGHSLYAKAVRT